METGRELKWQCQKACGFLMHVSQTRKNVEGSETQKRHKETTESSRLASALGRAGG